MAIFSFSQSTKTKEKSILLFCNDGSWTNAKMPLYGIVVLCNYSERHLADISKILCLELNSKKKAMRMISQAAIKASISLCSLCLIRGWRLEAGFFGTNSLILNERSGLFFKEASHWNGKFSKIYFWLKLCRYIKQPILH